jgi:hypothetical protein
MWCEVIRVAGVLCLTAGVVACEDKSLAMDAANLGNLVQVRASLACRAAAGYPVQLAELGESKGECPRVGWVLDARPDGGDLRYAGYVWLYRPISLPQRKGFEIQVISRPVRQGGCPRCRSYWLDESLTIRWAVGRPARPSDPERPTEQ